MKLDVDGKLTEDPDSAVIADSFESIDKKTGFFSGGISLVTLRKDEGRSLTAAGHPAEGFSLSYEDGEPDLHYNSETVLPLDETVRVFQRYGRGEDWGKDRFRWESMDFRESKTGKIIKLLFIGGFLAFVAYTLIRSIVAK